MMGPIGVPEILILCMILFSVLAIAWPAGRICRRIGFSPWLGVFAILPLANIALLWFVALSPWPGSRSPDQMR